MSKDAVKIECKFPCGAKEVTTVHANNLCAAFQRVSDRMRERHPELLAMSGGVYQVRVLRVIPRSRTSVVFP
jgi:hypothetical protein